MFIHVSGYGRGFGGTPMPRQFDSIVAAIAAIDGKTVVVHDGAIWTFRSGGGNWYFARNCAHYPTTQSEIDALAQFAAADLAVAETLFASTAKEPTQLPGLAKLLVAASAAIVARANASEYTALHGKSDLILVVRAAIAVLCAAACVRAAVAPGEMLRAARSAGDPCADAIVDDLCSLIYAPTTPFPPMFRRIGLTREALLTGLSQEVVDGEVQPLALLAHGN